MSSSTRPSSSSSSSSGYDERFVVPLEASRRGAHRARVSPVMAVLPVAAVVGIVVGAIALVYLFLGGGGSDAGADATTSAGPSASTSAPPSASDASSSPATDDSPSATVAPGAVDKTITLDVFNGTRPTVSGLARKAANKLTAAGWTTGKVETWTGAQVSQTTVYYGTTEQKASAQAIIRVLGRGTVKLSPSKAGTGMAVVIGNDYPGASTRGTGPTGRSTTAAASHSAMDGATDGASDGTSASDTAGASQATKTKGQAGKSSSNTAPGGQDGNRDATSSSALN